MKITTINKGFAFDIQSISLGKMQVIERALTALDESNTLGAVGADLLLSVRMALLPNNVSNSIPQ